MLIFYAECPFLFIVVLNAIVLRVVMLHVIMLSVVMLNVMAPPQPLTFIP
jgi:hypothetical protein